MSKLKKYEAFLEAFLGFGKKTVPYYYSKRFRDILRAIADNGDSVAQQLLYAEDSNQVSDDITLIDITEEENMVSFIQLNRMQKFRDDDTNDKKRDLESYVKNIWRYDNPLQNKGWTEQRTEISIGRFTNRVFQKAKITPEHSKIEAFVNSYKTRIKMVNDVESLFEFVKGDNIKKWYLEDNYRSNRGQLANSCMRYDKCQSYFDIYTKNPEVCQLLILKSDDDSKIIGRALIWKLKNGKTYMDRQYCSNDSDMNLYKEFAKKNGWLCYGNITETLEVQLKPQKIEKFPYMDTFICYNYKEHLLTNDEDVWPGEGGWYKLLNTNGGYTGDDVVWSDYNGEYISRQDAVYCQDVDDWRRNDQAIYLESKDRWYSNDSEDICWSEYMDEYLHIDDAVYSEFLETWLPSDDATMCWVNSEEEIAVPSDMKDNITKKIQINDEEKLCFSDSIMVNPFNGDWVFRKDTVKVYLSPKMNTYVTEEDAEMRDLEVDKSKYKRINLGEYISGQIGDVDPEKLLNYLVELKPSEEILKKIDSYFEKSIFVYLRDENNFTTIDKFNIIKCGIWFGYTDDEKTSYFRVRNRSKNNQRFVGEQESTFLKFMNVDAYSRLYSQGYWGTFMDAGTYMVWDIIQDPEMRKIYSSLKFL